MSSSSDFDRRLYRLDRQPDPHPHLPPVAVAAIQHPTSISSLWSSHLRRISRLAARQMSMSRITKTDHMLPLPPSPPPCASSFSGFSFPALRYRVWFTVMIFIEPPISFIQISPLPIMTP